MSFVAGLTPGRPKAGQPPRGVAKTRSDKPGGSK